MSNFNINISGDGTNSVPPSASPAELDMPLVPGTSITYINGTDYKVEISFSNTTVVNQPQFSIDAKSNKVVSITGICQAGKYHYNIYYDGMPGPDSKPCIKLTSSTSASSIHDDGNPNQGISGAVEK